MRRESEKQYHTASKITSGNSPAQIAPTRLATSPAAQVSKNPIEIPSADFVLHCSISWGSSRTIQHARDVDPATFDRMTRIGGTGSDITQECQYNHSFSR